MIKLRYYRQWDSLFVAGKLKTFWREESGFILLSQKASTKLGKETSEIYKRGEKNLYFSGKESSDWRRERQMAYSKGCVVEVQPSWKTHPVDGMQEKTSEGAYEKLEGRM